MGGGLKISAAILEQPVIEKIPEQVEGAARSQAGSAPEQGE